MENGRTALVTGATGVIGPELIRRLMGRGYRVRVLTRRPVPAGLLPRGVEDVIGDITDRDAVMSAVDGCHVAFHLAARLHVNDPGPEIATDYERVNVGGTRLLAEAAARAGVGRLVYFSSISVYGSSTPPEILDEDSPAEPASLYARTKRQAEELLLGAGQNTPLCDAVILRVAGVYGPRMKGNYVHVVRALRRGLFVGIGDGANRRTLVHVDDVAEGAIAAAEHERAPGRIFNLTDGSVHTFAEIVEAIAEALGRKPPRRHLPLTLVEPAARTVDGAIALAGRAPKVMPLLSKMTEDIAVRGTRIQDVLGFRPSVDLRAGWRDTIARLQ